MKVCLEHLKLHETEYYRNAYEKALSIRNAKLEKYKEIILKL